MPDHFFLDVMDGAQLHLVTVTRQGEIKAGQRLRTLAGESDLAVGLRRSRAEGAKYAVLLIPEDIGPRANLGRVGAAGAPEAFLKYFANMQDNRFFDFSNVLIAGTVRVQDLQTQAANADVGRLRELCAELDDRIDPLVCQIVRAGLCPIILGGGNNISLASIKGAAAGLRAANNTMQLSVINCDPHADFRRLEGRHSGNPFSYAAELNLLKRYCVFGLQQNFNNEDMLKRLLDAGFIWLPYEDFAITKVETYESALAKAVDYLAKGECPVGCELDLDAIMQMPSSARSPFGITIEQAAQFVQHIASSLDCAYFQLSEGAPSLSSDDGILQVGKTMALLVVAFITARERFLQQNPNVSPAIAKVTAN